MSQGKYIVKPKGFQGWSFTPVQKMIECGASECNAGNDVIFEVNGFSIHGKIRALESNGCLHQANPALDSITAHLLQKGKTTPGLYKRSVRACLN